MLLLFLPFAFWEMNRPNVFIDFCSRWSGVSGGNSYIAYCKLVDVWKPEHRFFFNQLGKCKTHFQLKSIAHILHVYFMLRAVYVSVHCTDVQNIFVDDML